ncbi:hypothetical protein BDQ12DRAFT_680565 [Crucibulum laeve]|uniref:Uncharacterized protein n=1 Tax=Crucibulum laeve TaxID=68775 RepID=A0A5C3M8Q1_9AGAR|nr:hypothetical protein BDQ12DRAFT_680565 [Crucibulum laeve]
MRFGSVLGAAFSVAALIASATSSPVGDANEPEVLVTAAFPETNAFNHVVNGEKNTITVTMENKSDRNVTLLSVTGSLHHPDSNMLIKNLTTLQYNVPLLEGVKLQVPYAFFSEFKPGDHRLNVWVEHAADDKKYRVEAYDSVVTIIEPEVSIFDFKLLSTYLVVATLLGGLSYFAYFTFVPQSKKTRAKKPAASSVSAPVGPVTATGAGGYQEEWIPVHHLKKPKSGRKQSGVISGTSGDELSGGETSGTEVRRRKGKK